MPQQNQSDDSDDDTNTSRHHKKRGRRKSKSKSSRHDNSDDNNQEQDKSGPLVSFDIPAKNSSDTAKNKQKSQNEEGQKPQSKNIASRVRDSVYHTKQKQESEKFNKKKNERKSIIQFDNT